jgi:hypothetical protein
VRTWRFPAGENPTRQPLQPEATGAAMQETNQRLGELMKCGYVEHCGNRYKMPMKLNVPNRQRHMQSNISIIQAAAKQLGGQASKSSSLSRVVLR